MARTRNRRRQRGGNCNKDALLQQLVGCKKGANGYYGTNDKDCNNKISDFCTKNKYAEEVFPKCFNSFESEDVISEVVDLDGGARKRKTRRRKTNRRKTMRRKTSRRKSSKRKQY